MGKNRPRPTPIEDIALNLIFVARREDRYNRSAKDYADIAKNLPPLKELEFQVNRLLREAHMCNGCNGILLPELCRFEAGHERVTYEPYPKSISIQTIRTALEAAGMRDPRWRKPKSK